MTGRPISSAMALAPSAVSVTRPGVVGTLCFANSSFAWYSKRSIDSLSLCVDVEGLCPTGQGELYPHELARSAPPTAHVVDLTAGQHVIQVTIPRWNTSSGCGQHWDLVNVPLVQITFRSRLEGHCRLARHRLSPAPDGVSTNDPTDGNPYAAVNYDAAITDIIPFNEFGDLADLEFRENCAFDRESQVIHAPELDDLHDTDNLIPLRLAVPSQFRPDPRAERRASHAYRDSHTDTSDGVDETDIIDISGRRGLHRKQEVPVKGRLMVAAMAVGATAAGAYTMSNASDHKKPTEAVLAADTSTMGGGLVTGSTDGMQIVSVAPAANESVHAEEVTKAAAFAQERAEREARLNRPLFV